MIIKITIRKSVMKLKLYGVIGAVILVFLCTPSFPVEAATREMELFSEAESRYYSRNYSIALEMYDEFIEKFPLSDLVPDVQYRRAVCHFRLGELEESKSLLNAIERRYRATRYIGYVPFWKGIILYREGDFSGSIDNLNNFLLKKRDQDLVPQALLYKTLSEVALTEYASASKSMTTLIEKKGPQGLTPYESLLYCYILLKARKYDQLITFQDSIEYQSLPEQWKERALLYRAEALWELGKVVPAEEIYRQLLHAYPQAAVTALRRLYLIAQQRRDFSEMESLILQAEKRFAGTPEILTDLWLQIGIETYNRGEIDLSQYFLNKIWQLRETQEADESVPIYLAEIYIKKGDLDSAESVLLEYRRVSGKDTEDVLMRLGGIYLLEGRYGEASVLFARMIRFFPNSLRTGESRYLLAYSQYRFGEYDKALENCAILLEKGKDESYRGEVLRLKVLVLKNMGNIDASLRALNEYLEEFPEDTSAHVDLVKLYFTAKRYDDVVSYTKAFVKDHPEIQKSNSHAFMVFKYFTGLSEISMKAYSDAFTDLSYVIEKAADYPEFNPILPYAIYYRGWAAYRMNDFERASEIFSMFLRSYPSHELYPQALFMSAWCYYSLGNFDKSNELFSWLAEERDHDLRDKAKFLQAKSLENLHASDRAARVFKELYTNHPGSNFADDALFEHAGILGELGNIDEAAEEYLKLHDVYPQSSLTEEALYKRGEVFFNNNRFAKAKTAFHDYRMNFPEGKLADAALYWEGFASYEVDEKRSAALLWETLINTYESSPFRPDAMLKTAELYTEFGEYQQALAFLNDLIGAYPEYSEDVDAELKANQVRYLIYGMSEREAELTARISKNRAAETKEGREAMIELSHLYIFEKESKIERAFQMLSQVLEKDDPVTGYEAQLLLGEYFYKREEYEKAGREFFKASLMNPVDQDFMAYSIFRAAQSMKLAGKTREAQELVKRLEENFPDTEWSTKGKKLLEGKE